MISRQFRKPRRFRKKKSIFQNRFFWLGILILIITGVIFYFLFLSSTFQVKKTIITGEEKASEETLQSLINKRIENKILFFETKSLFLVNSNEIKRDILNNFPQIAEVEIGRGFPDTLNVLVVERLGLATWCKEDNCFLLDNKGVIFEGVPPENDLPKIIDKQGIESFNLGEKVIEENILIAISDIKKQLNKNFEIDVEEFIIPNSEGLNVRMKEGWEIYFNPKEDINWQLTKLNLVLKEEIPPEKRGNLEYIDLRFTRVYYKYK